jgi:hypothetical protein
MHFLNDSEEFKHGFRNIDKVSWVCGLLPREFAYHVGFLGETWAGIKPVISVLSAHTQP